jgi:radical SAM superfamily enzyme YgiQ (UPF0313 family)
VGGPFIANLIRILPEKELKQVFTTVGADIYVYNKEGEEVLLKILKTIIEGTSLLYVENIFFRTDSSYSFTFYADERVNPNKIIPNWDYFKNDLTRNISIRTSISCTFSCRFCNYPVTAGKYHEISIENIELELKRLKQTNRVIGIYFIDDTLNFPTKRFKVLLKMMIKNKFNYKWNAHIRCQFLDEETIELMKESGCVQVLMGIESGNQQILNNMNKKVDVEKYYRGIELLNKHHILSSASVIVGFPGETISSYMDTFNLIEQTRPTFFRVHLWYYNTSAPINKFKENYGLNGEHYNWEHNTMSSMEAFHLVRHLFLHIENSIFETDFPLPFDLLTKGYTVPNIVKYMSLFNDSVKINMVSHTQDIHPIILSNLKSSLTL